MDKHLSEIAALEGVDIVLVGEPSGRILARVASGSFDDARPARVTGQTALLLASLYAVGHGVEEIDISYDDVRLVARGLHGTTLIALCNPNVDVAMLRLTLNVVLARIKNDANIMDRFPGWESILSNVEGSDIEQIHEALLKVSQGEVNYD